MKSPSRRSMPRRVALAGLVLAVVVFATLWIVDRYSRSRVETAARVHGQASGLELVDHRPPELPDGTANGSDFLEAAALLIEGQHLTYPPPEGDADADMVAIYQHFRDRMVSREPPSHADLERFREAIERFDLALAVLDRGVETATRARYRTNYDAIPMEIFVPNLLNRLRFATLLRARAEVALADGRPADAWDDAAAIYRLAHWTGEEMWTLINTLIARAMADHGALMVQTLLAEAPMDAATRAPVLAEARRADARLVMHRALDGERVAVWLTLLDPRTGKDEIASGWWADDQIQKWPRLAEWRPWLRLNAAAYLETVTPHFEACKQPVWSWDLPSLVPFKPRWADLAAQFAVGCDDLGKKRDLWSASVDHLEIALALESIRERDGAYPMALDDVGEGFIDPLSGEPYRYQRDGAGYRLWSVSANGVDDGGVAVPRSETGAPDVHEGDWVWSVAPAPAGADDS